MSRPVRLADSATRHSRARKEPARPRVGKSRPTGVTKGYESDVPTIKSACRVLEVFETFRSLRQPLRLSEISDALKSPMSSTHMLLHSLVALGYLSHDRQHRLFWPTPRIALLGSWISQPEMDINKWLPVMQELVVETGETVLLAQQNGLYIQYIHVVPSPSLGPIRVPIGSLRPMFRTAFGLMLASRMTDTEALALLRGGNLVEPDAAKRLPSEEALRLLAECRKTGYAYTRGASTPGLSQIAILLPSQTGQHAFSLGVGGDIPSLKRKKNDIVQKLLSLHARP